MDFTQQFLPEVYEKEVERYGNRTISGFLRMVGAEMPMASDQVVWSEQGRLHAAYDRVLKLQLLQLSIPAAAGATQNLIGPGSYYRYCSATVKCEKAYVSCSVCSSGRSGYINN